MFTRLENKLGVFYSKAKSTIRWGREAISRSSFILERLFSTSASFFIALPSF